MREHPRFLNAGNGGPFTLDGTRTYLVGRRDVAVIDPGPDVPEHVRALASEVEEADGVRVVLTHGHADHAGCARELARLLGVEVWGPEGLEAVDRPVGEGESISTDDGPLLAVHTPGHTADHMSYHQPEAKALFAGDHFLGLGDTTWVAEYPGCVSDYLESLERLRRLDLEVIYPAHGPPLEDPAGAIDRFEAHRRSRIEQAREALAAHPHASVDDLFDAVYGTEVPERVRRAATMSLSALVDFVKASES